MERLDDFEYYNVEDDVVGKSSVDISDKKEAILKKIKVLTGKQTLPERIIELSNSKNAAQREFANQIMDKSKIRGESDLFTRLSPEYSEDFPGYFTMFVPTQGTFVFTKDFDVTMFIINGIWDPKTLRAKNDVRDIYGMKVFISRRKRFTGTGIPMYISREEPITSQNRIDAAYNVIGIFPKKTGKNFVEYKIEKYVPKRGAPPLKAPKSNEPDRIMSDYPLDKYVMKSFINVFNDQTLAFLKRAYALAEESVVIAIKNDKVEELTRDHNSTCVVFHDGRFDVDLHIDAEPSNEVFSYVTKFLPGLERNWGARALIVNADSPDQPLHSDSGNTRSLDPEYATLVIALEEISQNNEGPLQFLVKQVPDNGIVYEDDVGEYIQEPQLLDGSGVRPALKANQGLLFDGRIYHRGLQTLGRRPPLVYLVYEKPPSTLFNRVPRDISLPFSHAQDANYTDIIHGVQRFTNLDAPYSKVTRESDGMRILVIHTDLPGAIAHVQVDVVVGDDNEVEPKERETAHFLEHLVASLLHSRNYPGSGNKQTAEELGIASNASTSSVRTSYFMNAHVDLLSTMIDMQVGAIVDFLKYFAGKDEARYTLEESAVRRELAAGIDRPDFKMYEKVNDILFPRHPRSIHQETDMKNILVMEEETVRAFFARYYVPQNMLVSVAGPVSVDDVLRLLKKYEFAAPDGVTKILEPPTRLNPPPFPPGLTVSHLHLDKAQTIRILFVWPLNARRFDAKALSVRAVSNLLAGGFSSRLLDRLRVRDGMVYSVSAYACLDERNVGFSTYQISTSANKDDVTTVINHTLEELHKLCAAGPDDAEIDKYRRRIKTSRERRLLNRSPTTWVEDYAEQVLFTGKVRENNEEYYESASRISASNIISVCNAIFDTNNMVILSAGPTALDEQIKKAVKEYINELSK